MYINSLSVLLPEVHYQGQGQESEGDAGSDHHLQLFGDDGAGDGPGERSLGGGVRQDAALRRDIMVGLATMLALSFHHLVMQRRKFALLQRNIVSEEYSLHTKKIFGISFMLAN